ncbi:YbaB/EbfC family nucleoid-associated protein [Nocardioides sp. R-C-SC26]|uniref:YbaB/EbfC family nucleoid-associated protein n=1 Tax=Nocardioides sp. R-C-SC26 TaxID=2870414 RepID=UPI001E2E2179|nr:YbaB/EbfC family nucleoid-associated protein [Nocardioides sp. R-C-SC26]
MSQNPLEGLLGGAGGFDLGGLLEQAQQMQQSMEEAQQRLAETEVEGTAGGGAVAVTINGIGELLGVRIQPGVVDGTDAESLGDLSDLLVAAFRDAKSAADQAAAHALGPLAGGLGGGMGGGLPGLPGA